MNQIDNAYVFGRVGIFFGRGRRGADPDIHHPVGFNKFSLWSHEDE